jgi:CHASE3 domain sensor protein
VQQKLDELGATIEEHKQGHADSALAIVNSDRGLLLMEQYGAWQPRWKQQKIGCLQCARLDPVFLQIS